MLPWTGTIFADLRLMRRMHASQEGQAAQSFKEPNCKWEERYLS
jgi:hypothetical protein